MKYSFLLSKVSGAALAAVASLAFLTTAAHAQQNLYFDPTGLQTGNGSGGSGEFDTDGTADFYLPGSGDQIFPDYATTPSIANFDGVGGTVTVNDPANNNGGIDPQPVATNFDGTSAYTVNGPGTIDYQVQNANTFIANSGGNVDIEANSTVTETPTGVNQLNITNSGSANLTIGGTMALSGSDLTAEDTDTNPSSPTYGLTTGEPQFSLLVNNTGGGTVNFNATVTNPNLGNTTASYYNGTSVVTQSVGEYFALTFTGGTNEFDGNILGTNTGYDGNSGSPTSDNLAVQGTNTTVLVDNSNFDRFEVEGNTSLLTNRAITINAQNNFTSSSGGTGTVGTAVTGLSTFTGSLADFGGNQTLTAVVAGGEVDFSGDIVYGNPGAGQMRIITGAGIVGFTNATGNDYENQYNPGVGANQTDVGTEITSGATLEIENTSGSATGGGGDSQNASNTVANGGVGEGANNVVQLDAGGTLAGTGITQQTVVAAGPTSTLSPGLLSLAKVSQIGTLNLDNGLSAASGLTVNFDINGTNNDKIVIASTTTEASGQYPVAGGAAVPLILGGTVTFNFTDLGTILTNNDYVLFTSAAGTPWDTATAVYDFSGVPAGDTATVFTVLDDANGNEDLDVVFTPGVTAIPEPSTWALMGLGALVLIGSGKFRKLRA